MRNPVEVFNRIKEFLPINLKHRMDWFIDDAYYKAPEQWPCTYKSFHEIFMDILGKNFPLKEKWKIQVLLIHTDKNISDLILDKIVNKDDIVEFMDELQLPELKVENTRVF